MGVVLAQKSRPSFGSAHSRDMSRWMRLFVVLVVIVHFGVVLKVVVQHWRELPLAFVRREGREDHDDSLAHEFRLLLCVGHRGEVVLDPKHQLHSKFFVSHLASSELELHAHFIASIEELFAVPDFGLVVVLIDVHAELDLLELCGGVLAILLLFCEFVFELAEVDDATDGRVGLRCDFDQIEPVVEGDFQGVLDFHDAELLSGRGEDYAHFSGTDPLVNAVLMGLYRTDLVGASPSGAGGAPDYSDLSAWTPRGPLLKTRAVTDGRHSCRRVRANQHLIAYDLMVWAARRKLGQKCSREWEKPRFQGVFPIRLLVI